MTICGGWRKESGGRVSLCCDIVIVCGEQGIGGLALIPLQDQQGQDQNQTKSMFNISLSNQRPSKT